MMDVPIAERRAEASDKYWDVLHAPRAKQNRNFVARREEPVQGVPFLWNSMNATK